MVPLVGIKPLHPPEAVQVEALVAVHDSEGLSPLSTAVGDAEIVTAGFAVPAVPPSIVTIAEVGLPGTAFSAPPSATANVLVPVNGFALLMGMLNVLAVASPLCHRSEEHTSE